jgi:hypothetical protein
MLFVSCHYAGVQLLTVEAFPLIPALRVEVEASREPLVNGRLCVFGFASACLLAVSMLSKERFLGSAFGSDVFFGS